MSPTQETERATAGVRAQRIAVGLVICTTLAAGCAAPPFNVVTRLGALTPESATSVPLANLQLAGDFGIGQLADGAGAFALFDGRCLALTNGVARPAPLGARVRQGLVTRYRWDTALAIKDQTSLLALGERLDAIVPNRELPCAVRVRGRFLSVNITASPLDRFPDAIRQTAPLPAWSYSLSNTAGTLIGFRLPAPCGALARPGLTLFFVAENLRSGGFAADCQLADGHLEVAVGETFTVRVQKDVDGDGVIRPLSQARPSTD